MALPVAVSMLLNILMIVYWPDHAKELRADPATGVERLIGVSTSSAASLHGSQQDVLDVSRAPSPALGAEPEPEPEPEAEARTAPPNSNSIGSIQGAGGDAGAAGADAAELKDTFTERFLQEKIGISTAHQIALFIHTENKLNTLPCRNWRKCNCAWVRCSPATALHWAVHHGARYC